MSNRLYRNGLLAPARSTPALRVAACAAMLAMPLLTPSTFAQSTGQASAQETRATNLWNLDKKSKLAIKGYDPVAYFAEGGGAATKGNPSISSDHNGATYYFATEEHKKQFLANPARYEPAHGGWCSWAMKDGDKVEVDPTKFIVKDNRLFLFYNGFWGDTRSKWLKQDHASQAATADTTWKKISGESSRSVPLLESSSSEQGGTEANPDTLEAKLNALAANFSKNASPETIATFEEGVREVSTSQVMTTAIKAGQKAPDFTLPDINNTEVRLADLLKHGPVILTWYRGGWCPYCNLQLREYQAHVDEFKSLDATIIAVSPQKVDHSLQTANSDSLTFPVLSDADNKVAKQYGLVYKLPESVAKLLAGHLKLSDYNETDSNELPLAVTYVIAQDGTIAKAFIDGDYRKRAEPADIKAALEALMHK